MNIKTKTVSVKGGYIDVKEKSKAAMLKIAAEEAYGDDVFVCSELSGCLHLRQKLLFAGFDVLHLGQMISLLKISNDMTNTFLLNLNYSIRTL